MTTRHGYSASGAAESYRDPVDEVTSTISDRIGRPRQRTYADGTSETWTYDGERVESTKDRQGRTFVYTYNTKGQLSDLRNLGGEVLESYGYDAAGRLATWTTRDARLVYENFDMEGRPRRTRQIRYADRSGFSTATVLDEHGQEHEWNVHGERSAWTMPLPANYAVPGWTNRVEEDHDAMGNVIAIRRSRIGSTAMSPLMTADYRNAGRPNVRTLTTTSGAVDGPSSSLRFISCAVGKGCDRTTHADVGFASLAVNDHTARSRFRGYLGPGRQFKRSRESCVEPSPAEPFRYKP